MHPGQYYGEPLHNSSCCETDQEQRKLFHVCSNSSRVTDKLFWTSSQFQGPWQLTINARSTPLIIFLCASYHHLHFPCAGAVFGKPGDYTTRWVILGIWTCTGLLVTIPNVVHGTDVYYGNTNFCMVFFSSHRAQLTASQGAGSIHSTSSSACWPTMFGWLSSRVILYPIMAITICGLAHRLNVVAHTAHRKTRDVTFHISRVYFICCSSHSYPIIYILCILPNCISRLLSFTNHTVPNRVILAANAIHALSGVLLYNAPCHSFWNSSWYLTSSPRQLSWFCLSPQRLHHYYPCSGHP